MHIDFHEQQVPDASTLLKFRHMLETNKLGEKLSADVNSRLDKTGLMMHGGTIVDASLIAAPKSTKNQEGKRDPEMHQTKNGNEKSAVRCKVEHPFLIVKKQTDTQKLYIVESQRTCIDSICCLPVQILSCAAGLAEQKTL